MSAEVATRLTWPVEWWPQQDREAWRQALQSYDPLEPSVGYASRWRPSTQRGVAGGYGRWLAWLDGRGELDTACRPGERATQARLRAYLQGMSDAQFAPYSVSGRHQQLGSALRAMEPDADWDWILRAASRIHTRAKPVKNPAAVLRPPEDVLALGGDLMGAAEQDRFRTSLDRAILFRDGLIIALLVRRPVRVANLAGIKLGHQLRQRHARWWAEFSAEEMKAGRHHEFPWPEELVVPLERYLEQHRRVLLKRGAV